MSSGGWERKFPLRSKRNLDTQSTWKVIDMDMTFDGREEREREREKRREKRKKIWIREKRRKHLFSLIAWNSSYIGSAHFGNFLLHHWPSRVGLLLLLPLTHSRTYLKYSYPCQCWMVHSVNWTIAAMSLPNVSVLLVQKCFGLLLNESNYIFAPLCPLKMLVL